MTNLLCNNICIIIQGVVVDHADIRICHYCRRYQRDIMTKRLNKRRERKLDGCKRRVKHRSSKSKCTCSKCTGFRYVQKKRVIEPDFLAHLAYRKRVLRNNDTSMDMEDAETVGEIAMEPGEMWWKNVINQRHMPPLYRGSLDVPTRSEYSSASSGFRSGTPDISSDALDVSRNVTPLSPITDKFCPNIMTRLSERREGSKSDSKILPCREDKASEVGPHATRSTSTKTTMLGLSLKRRNSSRLIKRKPDKRMKRTSGRTTSHASDSFSTCVKCSRILSKAI